MATYQPSPRFRVNRRDFEQFEERASKWMVAGLGVEAIGAAGGIVLSILGLIGLIPMVLASVALIVLGASLFAEASAVAANYSVIERDTVGNRAQEVELAGGLSSSSIGAVAAVALGILALIGIVPHILLSSGVITLGASGLLSSGEKERISHFAPSETYEPRTEAEDKQIGISCRASVTSAGLQVLASIGTVVLGILALVGIMPMVMNLVGLLVVSAAVFLSSALLTTKMAAVVRH